MTSPWMHLPATTGPPGLASSDTVFAAERQFGNLPKALQVFGYGWSVAYKEVDWRLSDA